MKIDMHIHTKPVSLCAHHTPEETVRFLKDAGIDAGVLTNHYASEHLNALSDSPVKQAEIYLDTYHRFKAEGDRAGFKAFFGVEVKLEREPCHPEFLLYGISEEDFLSSFPLYGFSQKELFEFCERSDIVMIQSHPYRTAQGYAPADKNYMHGVEAYNGHPCFDRRFRDTLELCEDRIKTAGSDFHIQSQAGLGGMLIPDGIDSQFELRDYLRQGEYVLYNEKGIIYTER